MLSQGELIQLSNNKEYAVVSSIFYEDVNYVYILDTESYKDYKLCKFENELLKPVKDEELLKILIMKFNEDLKENIAKIIEEAK